MREQHTSLHEFQSLNSAVETSDQLCSFGFTFSNLSLLACVYAEDFHPHGDDCSITGRFWMISYVISSLPLLVRLIQSVKRYVDSGLISHLINVSPTTTDEYFFFILLV